MTIDQLAAQCAARKDPDDLPGSLTPRERSAYLDETRVLSQRLTSARAAAETLSDVGPLLAADSKWLKHLRDWREILCDELLAIRSPIRDRAVKERCDNLTWSLKVVDHGLGISTLGPVVALVARIGDLMAAAGYETTAPGLHGPRGWRGSVKETERRVAELTKRKAEAEATLAEALLDDDARAARDSERAALSDVLNTMVIRNNADGSALAAYTTDGDPLPVSDMTDAQRHAFEAFARR